MLSQITKLFRNKLFLVILLATFFRLFLLSKVPSSLNWDEISMGYTAYSVAETGRDEWGELLPIFFRSYGEWKSAVYIYLLVPLVKIFGLNALAIRLPSALAGILSTYLIYLLGRRLYSEKVGLWSAFFMAVTPWNLVLSRPAFEANVSLTLMLAGIYYFLQAVDKKVYSFTIYSAVFFGLAPHTYNSAKVIVPFLVLYLVWQTKFYRQTKKLLLLFTILGFFALPLFLNLFTGRSQYRYSQVGVTTDLTALNEFTSLRETFPAPQLLGKVFFNKYTYTIYETTNNWLSYFDPSFLLLNGGDHNQHRLEYRGLLYFIEFIFIVFGTVYLLHERKLLSLLSLPFILIALGFLPAALTRDTHHVLRSLLSTPGFVLLAGIGITNLKNFRLRKILLLILTLEIISFSLQYFLWYPKTYARDWQYGHDQVVDYLKEHESEYDQIIMTKWFGEPQLFLAFYNRWDPTWYQEENKKNLVYEQEGRLWLDQLPEYTLGKYTFRYLDWQNETLKKRTLYIGKWDDFYEDSNIVDVVYYPDNSVAFYLVAGDR